MDKYIDVLTAHEYRYLTTRNKKQIAQELHALRYEIAREVFEEYWQDIDEGYKDITLHKWLNEQETITIDLLRRDDGK